MAVGKNGVSINYTPARAGYLDELAAANLPTDITAIINDLANGVDGLSALKTLIDAIPTTMVGTNNAALAASWTAALATALGNYTAARAGYLDQLDFALQEAIAAIPTTMVGTNNAALASAWTAALATALGNYTAARAGYLDELAAANLPTDITAIINDLANGTDGLGALKALIDAIPTTMVGTNSAALASSWTAALATALASYTAVRGGYLDQLDFNLQEAIAAIPTTMVGTNNAALASVLEDAMQKATGPAYNQDTDSLEALRELLDTIAGYLTTEIADILTDTGSTLPGLLSTIQTDLDNPSQYMANLTTLETRLSAARAGYLDELAAANLPTDVAGIQTDLDNAVDGLGALKALIDAIPTVMVGTNNAALAASWTAALATALAAYTAVRGGYLDELDFDLNARLGSPAGASLAADLVTIDNFVDNLEGRLTATRAGYLDQLDFALQEAIAAIQAVVDSAEAVGPFSYLDAGGEQDVVEDTATTRRRIWLDFSNRNMAQTGTFRIYRKVDGTNYDLYVGQPVTVGGSDERAFDAEFTTNQAWKLTYQEDVNEGAARAIPYNVVTQVIE
ncbi:hypothetical protein LCGC14_0992670 [marine sediment metagenome]|uniref:Uncharacterized protein n=1 Tax=marine sediment metagenome TaxID=412755 RepID=A0A0F9QNU2_9ZZZZ